MYVTIGANTAGVTLNQRSHVGFGRTMRRRGITYCSGPQTAVLRSQNGRPFAADRCVHLKCSATQSDHDSWIATESLKYCSDKGSAGSTE